MTLVLHNPHSVLAVLENRISDVVEIRLSSLKGLTEGWERVVQIAKRNGLPLQVGRRPGNNNNKTSPNDSDGRSSLCEAVVKEKKPLYIEELFSNISKNENGLWLGLDCLQDPHNVGAIFRTAAFFGVKGILLTQERTVSLTSTVYDVASGGVDAVPFAVETNLKRSLEYAKEQGLWILGSSEHANDDYKQVKPDRPWLLILGNEEKGMRRLTSETCDILCKISSKGKVESLNVSVAAGILISHLG